MANENALTKVQIQRQTQRNAQQQRRRHQKSAQAHRQIAPSEMNKRKQHHRRNNHVHPEKATDPGRKQFHKKSAHDPRIQRLADNPRNELRKRQQCA